MNRIELASVNAQKKCGELAQNLKDQKWHYLDSRNFGVACQNAVTELKGIQKQLGQLEKFLAFETMESEKDVQNKNREMTALIQKLETNLGLEQKKMLGKLAQSDYLGGEKQYSELFSALQHQTATTLLQTSYALEKVLLETKKDNAIPVSDKSTAQSLLELLKTREEEIQELKKNYSKARRDSLLGSVSEEGLAELEGDLQKNSQKIAVHQHQMEESLKRYGESTEKMFENANQLHSEINSLQQLLWNHFEKSQELVTKLKKERDFARQIALDTETETAGLRSQYSHELLGMQERIAHNRSQSKQEFDLRLQKMENELSHKTGLINHFKELVSKQSGQLHELQEKNAQLRMLYETYAKHDKVKKALKTKSNADSKNINP